MKAIAILMALALCGFTRAQQGSACTTPGGTTHYSGNFFDMMKWAAGYCERFSPASRNFLAC